MLRNDVLIEMTCDDENDPGNNRLALHSAGMTFGHHTLLTFAMLNSACSMTLILVNGLVLVSICLKSGYISSFPAARDSNSPKYCSPSFFNTPTFNTG